MKLRNKKTGEILGSLGSFIIQNPNGINCEAITKYNSLAELNEDWEDYEEPKLFKSIGTIGSSVHIEMGSAEEAKKAVESVLSPSNPMTMECPERYCSNGRTTSTSVSK